MDDDLDLRNFSGRSRLFPLPGVVMFPQVVLPLQIFEPRYRQMTEDALADDQLITIVQLRSPLSGPGNTLGSPPIETVGCLGRILQHERLPDGRFKLLLLGCKRVRLTREVPSDRLYRWADVEFLEDVSTALNDGTRRTELITLFRRAFERGNELDSDLDAILEKGLPLGSLTDIIAHAVGLGSDVKQWLLAEPCVENRADVVLTFLRQLVGSEAALAREIRPFPPPFSEN